MKLNQTASRAATLEAAHMLKMARSAHAYVRGNTVQFYEWQHASPVSKKLPLQSPVCSVTVVLAAWQVAERQGFEPWMSF